MGDPECQRHVFLGSRFGIPKITVEVTRATVKVFQHSAVKSLNIPYVTAGDPPVAEASANRQAMAAPAVVRRRRRLGATHSNYLGGPFRREGSGAHSYVKMSRG